MFVLLFYFYLIRFTCSLFDIKEKHIKIQESHLEILIPKSNTDQHREEHISRIKSEYCLVKYLEVYLQKAKLDISNENASPLIYLIFKTKSAHKISKTKRISYSRIRETFKGYIHIGDHDDKFQICLSFELGGRNV